MKEKPKKTPKKAPQKNKQKTKARVEAITQHGKLSTRTENSFTMEISGNVSKN